jgi:hypothetical protein
MAADRHRDAVDDLKRGGYQHVIRIKELQARAERSGGRLHVQRRGQTRRYAFVVDLDPRGSHRLRSEEPQVAHDLENAGQHVVELENHYGAP